MNNFFSPLFVSLFSPLRYLSLAFPSRPPTSHVLPTLHPPPHACPATGLHLSSIPSPSLLSTLLFIPTLPLSSSPLNLAPSP